MGIWNDESWAVCRCNGIKPDSNQSRVLKHDLCHWRDPTQNHWSWFFCGRTPYQTKIPISLFLLKAFEAVTNADVQSNDFRQVLGPLYIDCRIFSYVIRKIEYWSALLRIEYHSVYEIGWIARLHYADVHRCGSAERTDTQMSSFLTCVVSIMHQRRRWFCAFFVYACIRVCGMICTKDQR